MVQDHWSYIGTIIGQYVHIVHIGHLGFVIFEWLFVNKFFFVGLIGTSRVGE